MFVLQAQCGLMQAPSSLMPAPCCCLRPHVVGCKPHVDVNSHLCVMQAQSYCCNHTRSLLSNSLDQPVLELLIALLGRLMQLLQAHCHVALLCPGVQEAIGCIGNSCSCSCIKAKGAHQQHALILLPLHPGKECRPATAMTALRITMGTGQNGPRGTWPRKEQASDRPGVTYKIQHPRAAFARAVCAPATH